MKQKANNSFHSRASLNFVMKGIRREMHRQAIEVAKGMADDDQKVEAILAIIEHPGYTDQGYVLSEKMPAPYRDKILLVLARKMAEQGQSYYSPNGYMTVSSLVDKIVDPALRQAALESVLVAYSDRGMHVSFFDAVKWLAREIRPEEIDRLIDRLADRLAEKKD